MANVCGEHRAHRLCYLLAAASTSAPATATDTLYKVERFQRGLYVGL